MAGSLAGRSNEVQWESITVLANQSSVSVGGATKQSTYFIHCSPIKRQRTSDGRQLARRAPVPALPPLDVALGLVRALSGVHFEAAMALVPNWHRLTLTDDQLRVADALCDQWQENAKAHPQEGYAHTPDGRHQDWIGAAGEVAFRVLTGRPIPPIAELVATWYGPDVDERAASGQAFGVKSISDPRWDLRLYPENLFPKKGFLPPTRFVLMYVDRGVNGSPTRVALVGSIPTDEVLRPKVARWADPENGDRIPRACYLVSPRWLDPWPVEEVVAGPHVVVGRPGDPVVRPAKLEPGK